MIALRHARPEDAVAIGAVHVAAWRSTYPGILPDKYLARLSVTRYAAYYEQIMRDGGWVWVAALEGPRGAPRVVGFATAGRGRERLPKIAEGEIETLYVLDDYRDQGLGRGLLRACGASLAAAGCRSAFLWVLSENPNRWFYERMGGTRTLDASVLVAGRRMPQTAFVWDPIERLLGEDGSAG